MPKLTIAVRTACLRMPLKKALHTAARQGARAVEIDARNELTADELTATGARQLRKMLDDLNLRVASVRFPTRRGFDVAEDLDRRIDATRRAMQMAYRLGAPVVVNQIGRVPADPADPGWQQLHAVMEDLGRYGARVGAFLAAETGTEPGADLARLLEAVEDAYIAVALNPGKLIIHGHDVPDAARALGSWVQVVEARDGVRDLAEGRGMEVPLGRGLADFPQILGVLEDHQFRGPLVVGREGAPDPEAEIAQAIEYLGNL